MLGGKWIAAGKSRGGDMTLTYGYYFPEDMDRFIPYVAPGGLAQDDPRFFSFIYGSIGDAAFGEEEARKTREQVLAFQVMMLRHKPELLADYEARAASAGYVFRPQAEAAAWMDECPGR